MNLRLILPAAAAVLLAASCTPYVEPPPEQPTDPAGRKPTPEEQEKIRQQREEQKKKDEANQTPDRDTKPEGETGAITEQPKNTEGSGGAGGSAPEKPATPQKEIPVARPVPGKPGYFYGPAHLQLRLEAQQFLAESVAEGLYIPPVSPQDPLPSKPHSVATLGIEDEQWPPRPATSTQ